jgi:pSer/pThr/pTyr-binding forkhead associated (FHA) protein
MATVPRVASVSVRLRHRQREIVLAIGTHIVGRHKSCDVVLDSGHVSRRHVRMHVTRNGLLVEDLESANGVYVNGERLGTEPVRVRTGDRLLLGEEELEVVVDAPSRPISDKLLIARPGLFAKSSDDDLVDSDPSSPGTRTADFFDLVGKIVDRALAEGRIDDASTMLKSQLGKILADARARRPFDASTREGALRYSLALARAYGGGPWLDYALDLLTALRWAPDGPLARDIEQTLEAAASVDDARLALYVTTLEATEDRLEALRIMHWARGLGRAVAKKSR